jgi:hypothetical protein
MVSTILKKARDTLAQCASALRQDRVPVGDDLSASADRPRNAPRCTEHWAAIPIRARSWGATVSVCVDQDDNQQHQQDQ